jgi:outer membrane protein assembly factor BamA
MWVPLVLVLLAGPQGTAAQPPETVAAIQIQGNTATPDEEVRRLADVRVGMPFDATTADAVATRLRAQKRFERV